MIVEGSGPRAATTPGGFVDRRVPPRPIAFPWRVAVTMALTIGVLAAAGFATASTEDADRAFAAGDHERALALYDDALATNPDDVHALVRSGKLLSWSRQYDEAIARYDRVLAERPDHREAALERAKAMSWDRRFCEASDAFSDLVERDPSDTDARLGYARTLSWSGRQRAARAEYRQLFEERGPAATDAALGMAQTYAWSGHPQLAREWYGRLIDLDPGRKEAELGMAYADLGERRFRSARERTDALAERFPDDTEVADLDRANRRATAPWIRATADHIDDTDDNELSIARVEGGIGFGYHTDLTVGVAHYDLESPGLDGTIDSLYAVLGVTPTPNHRVTFRAGVDDKENSAGVSSGSGIGGVRWTWRARPSWTVGAGWNRDTLRYSPTILDNDVALEVADVSLSGRPAVNWRVSVGGGVADYNDGNERVDARAEAIYRFLDAPVWVESGYAFRFMDFDLDLANGYFDPEDFESHTWRSAVGGRHGKRGVYWRIGADVGVQSFTLGGVDVSDDTVFGAEGLLGVPFRKARGAIEFYVNRTDYAAQSAAGFESRWYGVRWRWVFGAD